MATALTPLFNHASVCSLPTVLAREPQAPEKLQRLARILGLLSLLCLLETGVGWWSHTLALMADGGHLFADLMALGLTLMTTWWGRYDDRSSRMALLVALVNGCSLLLVAIAIAVAALHQLQTGQEPEVVGWPLLLVACLSLGINGCNIFWLHPCSQEDLNIKSALLHLVADWVSAAGVLVAAIAVSWLGCRWADGVVSLLVAGLITLFSLPLIWQSWLAWKRATPLACQCRQNFEKLLYPSLEERFR